MRWALVMSSPTPRSIVLAVVITACHQASRKDERGREVGNTRAVGYTGGRKNRGGSYQVCFQQPPRLAGRRRLGRLLQARDAVCQHLPKSVPRLHWARQQEHTGKNTYNTKHGTGLPWALYRPVTHLLGCVGLALNFASHNARGPAQLDVSRGDGAHERTQRLQRLLQPLACRSASLGVCVVRPGRAGNAHI